MSLLPVERGCLRIAAVGIGCWGVTAFLASRNMGAYEALPAVLVAGWLVLEAIGLWLARRKSRRTRLPVDPRIP